MVILTAILLAAGEGKRMRSAMPKVLHALAGKPLIGHLLETLNKIPAIENCLCITGHKKEQVEEFCESNKGSLSTSYIEQRFQLGTGNAAACALPYLSDEGISLILYADAPFLSDGTIIEMINQMQQHDALLLTKEVKDPHGFGRILRSGNELIGVIEEKDATDVEKQINEISTGIFAIRNSCLKHYLPQINNENAQQEYYLTDIIGLMVNDGLSIHTMQPGYAFEAKGVNNKSQLANLEREYQNFLAQGFIEQGVTLADPHRFDCRGKLKTGKDVFIDQGCIFHGNVILGDQVSIGANCIVGEPGQTVCIGDRTEIKPHSIIVQADIGEACSIGPFAHIRAGSQFENNVKIGNFVETKQTKLGASTKINHLTYAGDLQTGNAVNVGAGTINCNYDGEQKHQTVLGDGVFIGSNVALVAPVHIGDNAFVAAGSTITEDVDADQLAIARHRQHNKDHRSKP